MIDIRMPKEVRDYKEKIYFGLTTKQLICSALVLLINVPLYWYGREIIGDDLIGWVVIIVACPFFAIGFIKYNGLKFEELMIAIIKFELLAPQKRKVKTKNFYEIMDNYILTQEAIQKNKRGDKRAFRISKKKKK